MRDNIVSLRPIEPKNFEVVVQIDLNILRHASDSSLRELSEHVFKSLVEARKKAASEG